MNRSEAVVGKQVSVLKILGIDSDIINDIDRKYTKLRKVPSSIISRSLELIQVSIERRAFRRQALTNSNGGNGLTKLRVKVTEASGRSWLHHLPVVELEL